jgi:hypothetical protein
LGKILIAPIQQALHKYCIPRLSSGTELLISSLGFDAELNWRRRIGDGEF